MDNKKYHKIIVKCPYCDNKESLEIDLSGYGHNTHKCEYCHKEYIVKVTITISFDSRKDK